MRETATLLQGFKYYTPEYRPFDELEVPGVSLLVASAAAAGYYPIAEYAITKVNKADRRHRRQGRADLWFIAGESSYSFEFKRAWNISTAKQIRDCIEYAANDASEIPPDECNYAFGGVIAPVFNEDSIGVYESVSDADYVFAIADDNYMPIYFYFKQHVR